MLVVVMLHDCTLYVTTPLHLPMRPFERRVMLARDLHSTTLKSLYNYDECKHLHWDFGL